ncbi:MAG: hypothetical protein A2Y10_00435 [Planctomycetes bacterium GWF2_41_51]|nr:MAG: hypothetical protein A2Y10_00435 [Planctomycetes bacterium GWF2_41_51]
MGNIKMHIINQGKVFKGSPNSELAKSCFPFAVKLSNGDLIVSFQAASVKNGIDSKSLISRSNDNGLTWSQAEAVFDPTLNGKKGVLHLSYISELQSGKLIAGILWCDHYDDSSLEFFNAKTGGLLPTEACISFSEDNGKTWSKLKAIEKGDLGTIPTPVMGPVHRLESGCLILPFETSKSYDDESVWLHKACYFVSYDGGKTWPKYKIVAHDPECKIYYWDHRIANLGRGKLVDLFWAYDAVNNKELNAYLSSSTDFGENWTRPEKTKIVGQPWPIPIDGDTFAVVAVDRNFTNTIKLYLTNNFGKDFNAAEALIIYDNKKAATVKTNLNDQLVEMTNWSYGLPSGCKLNDKEILIVYYAGDSAGVDINWCKVKL